MPGNKSPKELSMKEKFQLLDALYPGPTWWRARDEIKYDLEEGYDPYDWTEMARRLREEGPYEPLNKQ